MESVVFRVVVDDSTVVNMYFSCSPAAHTRLGLVFNSTSKNNPSIIYTRHFPFFGKFCCPRSSQVGISQREEISGFYVP